MSGVKNALCLFAVGRVDWSLSQGKQDPCHSEDESASALGPVGAEHDGPGASSRNADQRSPANHEQAIQVLFVVTLGARLFSFARPVF